MTQLQQRLLTKYELARQLADKRDAMSLRYARESLILNYLPDDLKFSKVWSDSDMKTSRKNCDATVEAHVDDYSEVVTYREIGEPEPLMKVVRSGYKTSTTYFPTRRIPPSWFNEEWTQLTPIFNTLVHVDPGEDAAHPKVYFEWFTNISVGTRMTTINIRVFVKNHGVEFYHQSLGHTRNLWCIRGGSIFDVLGEPSMRNVYYPAVGMYPFVTMCWERDVVAKIHESREVTHENNVI
jgi:hypothetical protein